jgi:hypothetical protein
MSLLFLAPFIIGSGGPLPVTVPDLPWSPAWTHDLNASGVTCYAVLEWNTNGTLKYNGLGSGPSTNGDAGNWLVAGTASDYYLEITNLSGSPGTLNYVNDMSGGRVQLGVADRHVGVQEITTGQSHVCTFDIEYYNVSSGGTPLFTQSFTLDAQKDSP